MARQSAVAFAHVASNSPPRLGPWGSASAPPQGHHNCVDELQPRNLHGDVDVLQLRNLHSVQHSLDHRYLHSLLVDPLHAGLWDKPYHLSDIFQNRWNWKPPQAPRRSVVCTRVLVGPTSTPPAQLPRFLHDRRHWDVHHLIGDSVFDALHRHKLNTSTISRLICGTLLYDSVLDPVHRHRRRDLLHDPLRHTLLGGSP